MGYLVEISDRKAEEMAEHAEKVLRHGGKLMQCIEELCESARYGERGGYGHMGERSYGRYGMRDEEMPRHDGYDHMGERYDRMGERHPREWEDDPYMMGERRGRSMSTGRYIRR